MTADPPLVSIVIASFNYGRFLADAIQSAQAQTHPNLEVIVVDDGSTDDSREVARRFPVKLVEQANAGVANARNRGARLAAGEFLVFLDADDQLEPEYVARCLGAVTRSAPNVAYAYTQMRYFGAQSGIHPSGPFSRRRILRGNLVNASALVKRAAFEHAGGFDPSWRIGHEDFELWVRLFSLGYHGVFVPEPLIRYRRHGHSRNVLSRAQLADLSWRLWWSYPRLYWPRLLVRPLRLVRSLLRPPA